MKKLMFVFFLMLSIIGFSQPVPYNVNKRKFPLGDQFQKLIPVKLGTWERFAFHDYIPGQEDGRVYYKRDDDQIFLVFGKVTSQNEMKMAWQRIYDDATDGKESQIKEKNTTSTSTKFVLMDSKSHYFYAWTRNLYYFSIDTKNKTLADEFMKLFPY